MNGVRNHVGLHHPNHHLPDDEGAQQPQSAKSSGIKSIMMGEGMGSPVRLLGLTQNMPPGPAKSRTAQASDPEGSKNTMRHGVCPNLLPNLEALYTKPEQKPSLFSGFSALGVQHAAGRRMRGKTRFPPLKGTIGSSGCVPFHDC
jgi:hypothetical protein